MLHVGSVFCFQHSALACALSTAAFLPRSRFPAGLCPLSLQQMLENWWFEPATLRSMSGRWDKLDEKLPAEEAAKLQVSVCVCVG